MPEVARLPPKQWRAPEELVSLGFQRSRVVMMNEAHNGLRRSVRTRLVGRSVLAAAHEAGVRHLAMEALNPWFAAEANATRDVPDVDQGYLSQPEMRELIAAALALGWTLTPYEADFAAKPAELKPLSLEGTNWREGQQARNLCHALDDRPDRRVLVWCGNHHLVKFERSDWRPMGLRFWEISGIEPFCIDQTPAVAFDERVPLAAAWVQAYANVIQENGGVLGFLAEDAPDDWCFGPGLDAFVLAIDNELS